MSILATDNIQNTGIIPYGADDDTVIFKCPLTSAASVTSLTTGIILDNGGLVFDKVKGVTTNAVNNYVRFAELASWATASESGQLSFEVEKNFIWSDLDGSGPGALITANAWAVVWGGAASTGVDCGRLYRNNITENLRIDWKHTTSSTLEASGLGDDDFVTITISWNGATQQTYIDGRPQFNKSSPNGPEGRVTTFLADPFKYIWIGNDRGNTTNGHLSGYYIRNIQLSSRPVMLATHSVITNCAIIGHSFITAGVENYTNQGPAFDKGIGRSIKGYFANIGLRVDAKYYHESGATLDPALSATDLAAEFAAAVATRPNCAVIVAGTNDVQEAAFTAAAFETAYKGYIDDLVATCEIIVVCTVPTLKAHSSFDTQTYIDNTAAANVVINALPSYNAKVIVSDIFTLMGGESLGSNYFVGEYTGANNDLHPSASGHKLIGDNIGRKLNDGLF